MNDLAIDVNQVRLVVVNGREERVARSSLGLVDEEADGLVGERRGAHRDDE